MSLLSLPRTLSKETRPEPFPFLLVVSSPSFEMSLIREDREDPSFSELNVLFPVVSDNNVNRVILSGNVDPILSSFFMRSGPLHHPFS